MGLLNVVRTVVHVLAILVSLVAIGFTTAAFLSSGWQIMTEPGTGEIHQHGLWLDYNYIKQHVASDQNHWQWVFNYKYGKAVNGDEAHRAQHYQENTLILLAIATFLGIVGTLLSYCATLKSWLGYLWSGFLFLATILSAAGLIQFFVEAMSLEHRYVNIHGKVEQFIGYSFWYGVAGSVGFALAMVMSVVCIVILVLMNRRGEKTERAPFTFKRGNNTQV